MENSCKQSGVNSGPDFSNQPIQVETLRNDVFENCNFQNSTIVGDLRQIKFQDCDFSNAKFQQVQLGSFQSCNFCGATLSEVITSQHTKLINCNL